MKFFALLFSALCLLVTNAFAGVSARRFPNESFSMAKARNTRTSYNSSLDANADAAAAAGPEALSRPMNQLKLADIPAVQSYDLLVAQFKYIRDSYFIQTPTPRRLTWLYPDDGCYARAELAAEHLIAAHTESPKKVFAFGDLHAATKNSPQGYVEWWYHVAVIYRVGNMPYVLDPALDPYEPMTLPQWGQAIGGNATNVKYTICSKDTFDPDSACIKPPSVDQQMADSEQRIYLPDEWSRLLELGRDPNKELGSQPPWL